MKISPDLPRLKGFRYPREIIGYAVWAYNRFAMSTANVGAGRAWYHCRETVRLWVNRFAGYIST